MNASTINASTFRLRSRAPARVPAAVSTAATRRRSIPTRPSPRTLYQATVAGRSRTPRATRWVPTRRGRSRRPRSPSVTDTTVAEFGAGTSARTRVSPDPDGEMILEGAVTEEFRFRLCPPAGPAPPGEAEDLAVAGGKLTVDGTRPHRRRLRPRPLARVRRDFRLRPLSAFGLCRGFRLRLHRGSSSAPGQHDGHALHPNEQRIGIVARRRNSGQLDRVASPVSHRMERFQCPLPHRRQLSWIRRRCRSRTPCAILASEFNSWRAGPLGGLAAPEPLRGGRDLPLPDLRRRRRRLVDLALLDERPAGRNEHRALGSQRRDGRSGRKLVGVHCGTGFRGTAVLDVPLPPVQRRSGDFGSAPDARASRRHRRLHGLSGDSHADRHQDRNRHRDGDEHAHGHRLRSDLREQLRSRNRRDAAARAGRDLRLRRLVG